MYPKVEDLRASMLSNSDNAVDGEFDVPGAEGALFFRVFHHHRYPKILKIPNQPTVVDLEVEMYNQLLDKGIGNYPLVPVEKLSYERRHKFPEKQINAGILMPLYPYTMHDLPPPIPSDIALSVIGNITQAIVFIHDNGWMHGDVKSANIFMDINGMAYLGDNGCSCSYDKLHKFHHGGTINYQCSDVHAKVQPKLFNKVGLAISFVRKVATNSFLEKCGR